MNNMNKNREDTMSLQEMRMTRSGTEHIHAAALQSDSMKEASNKISNERIETRFGVLQVAQTSPVHFPTGMLGLPTRSQFCIGEFPSERLNKRFKLLQSLEDHELSFITLPIEATNPIIQRADMDQAAKDLGIDLTQSQAYLVVTVHRNGNVVQLSVNARAPIFVHNLKRTAQQYVFPHSKYEIRHMISM